MPVSDHLGTGVTIPETRKPIKKMGMCFSLCWCLRKTSPRQEQVRTWSLFSRWHYEHACPHNQNCFHMREEEEEEGGRRGRGKTSFSESPFNRILNFCEFLTSWASLFTGPYCEYHVQTTATPICPAWKLISHVI